MRPLTLDMTKNWSYIEYNKQNKNHLLTNKTYYHDESRSTENNEH